MAAAQSICQEIFEHFASVSGKRYCRTIEAFTSERVDSLKSARWSAPGVILGESRLPLDILTNHLRLIRSETSYKLYYLNRNADTIEYLNNVNVRSMVAMILDVADDASVIIFFAFKPNCSLTVAQDMSALAGIILALLRAPQTSPLADKEPFSARLTHIIDRKAKSHGESSEVGALRFLEVIPHMVFTTLPSGKIDYCNRRWFDYTGADQTDSREKDYAARIHPSDFGSVTDKWLQTLSTNEALEVEFRIRRASDGTYRWHLARAIPQLDSNGRVLRWFGTVTDINQQKLTEQMLRDVMDNVPTSIFWKNRESVYLGCNKTFAKVAGQPATAEIKGKTDYEMPWTDEEKFLFRRDDAWVMVQNKPAKEYTEKVLQADGRHALVRTSKVPMYDAVGNVIGVLGMMHDITDEYNMRVQRDDFMSSLAHDMKVPIIAAVRVLDFMLRGAAGNLSNEQADCIKMLHESHENLLFLIQNLLEVLRYESEHKTMPLHEFEFSGFSKELLDQTQKAFKEKQLRFEMDTPKAPIFINGNQEGLERAISNLFRNASILAYPETPIKIKCDRTLTDALLTVEVNSIPISADEKEYLFDRCWQGARLGIGVGLSFYLSRQILEWHGGDIECTSEPGTNTIFHAKIPLQKPDGNAPGASISPFFKHGVY
jgi:PAS domain S-box-containing protein